MKRIILGILVAVFIFGVVGNCIAGGGDTNRKPTKKPTSDEESGF